MKSKKGRFTEDQKESINYFNSEGYEAVTSYIADEAIKSV